jgi:hypothetical protein
MTLPSLPYKQLATSLAIALPMLLAGRFLVPDDGPHAPRLAFLGRAGAPAHAAPAPGRPR